MILCTIIYIESNKKVTINFKGYSRVQKEEASGGWRKEREQGMELGSDAMKI